MNNTSLTEIIQLSISERLQLVEDIWDSITAIPGAIPLTDEQKKELDHRLLEYKLQPGTGIPWDKVKEKIQSLK
jgi:putative addiction module component (TIGR02574 family)